MWRRRRRTSRGVCGCGLVRSAMSVMPRVEGGARALHGGRMRARARVCSAAGCLLGGEEWASGKTWQVYEQFSISYMTAASRVTLDDYLTT